MDGMRLTVLCLLLLLCGERSNGLPTGITSGTTTTPMMTTQAAGTTTTTMTTTQAAGTTTRVATTQAAGTTTRMATTQAAGTTTPTVTTKAAGTTTPMTTTQAAGTSTPTTTTQAAGTTTPTVTTKAAGTPATTTTTRTAGSTTPTVTTKAAGTTNPIATTKAIATPAMTTTTQAATTAGTKTTESATDDTCGVPIKWDTDHSGSIHFPSTLGLNNGDLQCEWSIEAPSNMGINISFDNIDMDNALYCEFSYLEVVDMYWYTLVRLCGSQNQREPYFYPYSFVRVRLVSGESAKRRGFSVRFAFEALNENMLPLDMTAAEMPASNRSACESTQWTNGTHAGITFPSEGNYFNNEQCLWNLTSDVYLGVSITALDIEFEESCAFDALEFSTSDGAVQLQFCGTVAPKEKLFLPYKQLQVNFQSDYSGTGRGFSLTYRTK